MPIDFAAIAATYRPPIRLQIYSMTASFRALARWLAKRHPEAQATERATRDYPIILFYNGALTVWIDSSQRDALLEAGSARSVWDRVRAAGDRFLEGLGRVPLAAREDWLLPGLISRLQRTVALIERSVNRFIPPTSDIFARSMSGTSSASDIFGGAALGVYAYMTSRDQMTRFLADVDLVKRTASAQPWGEIWRPISGAIDDVKRRLAGAPANSGQGRPGAGGTSQTPSSATHAAAAQAASSSASGSGQGSAWPALLESIVRGLAGALLIIPLLPRIIGPIAQAAILQIKSHLIATLQEIETLVFDLRRQLLELLFVDLRAFGTRAFDLAVVASALLMQHLEFYTKFASIYVRDLLARVKLILDIVSFALRVIIRVVEALRSMVEAVLNFDLMTLIAPALGLPGAIIAAAGGLPRFTIDDLIEVASGVVTTAARITLTTFLDTVEYLLFGGVIRGWVARRIDRATGQRIQDRIRALRQILDITVRLPPRPSGHGTALVLPRGRFPDLGATFAPLIAGLGTQLGRLRDLGQSTVGTLLGSSARLLANLSVEMSQESERAATMGSPGRYSRISRGAVTSSDILFGDQMRELATRARTSDDALARGFEGAIVRGGFYMIEQALPLYIGAMRSYWHERAMAQAEGSFGAASPLPSYDMPTSPHLIDRRARLGRVRMPRLTIRAPRHTADENLATTVAARFKQEVESAYRTGLEAV